jgi:hypothetical protein
MGVAEEAVRACDQRHVPGSRASARNGGREIDAGAAQVEAVFGREIAHLDRVRPRWDAGEADTVCVLDADGEARPHGRVQRRGGARGAAGPRQQHDRGETERKQKQ